MITGDSADHPTVTGRRAASRARVVLPATLETLNGRAKAVLRNVSESGALLEVGSTLLTVGSDAVLSCGDFESFGTIVWVRSRWCGFAFEEPVSEEAVLRLRAASDTGDAAAAYHRQLTEAAQRWAGGSTRA